MKALAAILFVVSSALQAEVVGIDIGNDGEDHLVFLEDGTVRFIEHSNKAFINTLSGKIKGLAALPLEAEDSTYRPTVLPDVQSAYSSFGKMRPDYKEESGQCYNMAHVWAYDEFKRIGLRSMKLFMFFTNKYIRNHKFPWWFHVSPAVFVSQNNAIARMILDRRYTTYPMGTKEWTDMFIETERPCKEVNKYAEFFRASQVEDCYLIETSMYFWQPKDIIKRDVERVSRRIFVKSEIKHAIEEAFKSAPRGQ